MTGLFAELKNPSMFMLWGLLFSYAGSSIITGAVPTMVAAGLVATGWIPVYSTLSTVFNGSAWLIAQLLRNASPYRMLLLCETYDIAITLIALVLFVGHFMSQVNVVLIYITLVAVVPVVTNIANNVYAGTLSLVSEPRAARFNSLALSLITLATLVVGRPLGSLLVDFSLYLILLVNLLLTGLSFIFRVVAMRRDTFYRHAATYSIQTSALDAVSRPGLIAGLKLFRGRILCLSASSPLTTAVIYLGLGLYLYYLPLWFAQGVQHKGSIVAAAGGSGGLGSLVAPMLFYYLKARFSYRSQIAMAAAITGLFELCMLLLATLYGQAVAWSTLALYMLLLFATYLGAAYVNIANLTARQTRFAGANYHHMVGLSYSFNCLLTLVGTWSGYWLQATTDPRLPLLLAALLSGVTALVILKRKSHPPLPTADQSSPGEPG